MPLLKIHLELADEALYLGPAGVLPHTIQSGDDAMTQDAQLDSTGKVQGVHMSGVNSK